MSDRLTVPRIDTWDTDLGTHSTEQSALAHNRPSCKEFLSPLSIRAQGEILDSKFSDFALSKVPDISELEPHRWDRECYEVAASVAQQYPHLKQEAGFYVHPQLGAGDHGWNIAPDGTIVDMTATQHDYSGGEDEQDDDYKFPAPAHPEIIPPDHPLYDRYVSWTRHKVPAQLIAHDRGEHYDGTNPQEFPSCPKCNLRSSTSSVRNATSENFDMKFSEDSGYHKRLIDHMMQRLGPESLDPYEKGSPWTQDSDYESLPSHVYRAMSEDHFQQSMLDGYHASDERGNYIGQAKADPHLWEGQTPEAEGTVAGRWAYPGYLTNSDDLGRIVKIKVHPKDGWENHPDDDEGGYLRTFKPIPTERFESWTDPIDSRGFKLINRIGRTDFEKFGAGNTPFAEGDPIQPWKPGVAGKGMILNGQPHMWAITDQWGGPHHADVAYHVDPTEEHSPEGYFHIHPDGTVEAEGHGDSFSFVKHDPRLKPSDRDKPYYDLDWDEFDNTIKPTQPRLASPVTVHELSGGWGMGSGGYFPPEDLDEVEEWGGEGWGDRRPVLYNSHARQVYVGDYDVTHNDVAHAAQREGLLAEGTGHDRHDQHIYHGWIGPNPEADDAQPDENGYMIHAEGTPHEYGWYTPLPEEHAGAVGHALKQHFNAREGMEDFDFEKFGSIHHLSAVKYADKLNGFLRNPKSRPDLQTPEGQALLDTLETMHNERTDPLMPWLAREWKKGRLKHKSPNWLWFDEKDGIGGEVHFTSQGLSHWGDWYHSKHPSRKGDIMQWDIHDVHDRVNQWDDDMEALAHEKALHGGKVIHKTPDGWTIRQLHTPEELEAEGEAMGHCVGGYHRDVADGRSLIYSLRDKDSKPHATIEIEPIKFTPTEPFDIEKALANHSVFSKPDLEHTVRQPLRDFHTWYQNDYQGPQPESVTHFKEQHGDLSELHDVLMNSWERDQQRNRKALPHGGKVVQIQGKGNKEPIDEYKARIHHFFQNHFEDHERPTWDENGDDLSHPDDIEDHHFQQGDDEYGLPRQPPRIDWYDMFQRVNTEPFRGGWRLDDHYEDQIDRMYELAKTHGQIPEFASHAQEFETNQMDDYAERSMDYREHPYDPDAWAEMSPEDAKEAEEAYEWEEEHMMEQHPGVQAANYAMKKLIPHYHSPSVDAMGQPVPDGYRNEVNPAHPAVFSKTAGPVVREYKFDSPWGKDPTDPWAGRRPIVYHEPSNSIHIGPLGTTHVDVQRRTGIPKMRQNRRDPTVEYHGWIGYNPESEHHRDPMINEGEANEYGWYGAHPGPHVDAALEKHFKATKSDDEIDFEKFGHKIAMPPPEYPDDYFAVIEDERGFVHKGESNEPHESLIERTGVTPVRRGYQEVWLDHDGKPEDTPIYWYPTKAEEELSRRKLQEQDDWDSDLFEDPFGLSDIDFDKFGRTAAAIALAPPEITGVHPMVYRDGEVRVGWPHQFHDELSHRGKRALVRPGSIEWLYTEPPDEHHDVANALIHHYGQPFETKGADYDFERFSGMTLNQEKKAWPGPVGEKVHQFDNGYHIVRHNSPEEVVQVGQHMHNCWQNGGHIDIEQGPYAEDPYRRTPVSWMSLHDEHGLPRAAFYLRNNPRSFEPLKILQVLGPRNRKLPDEHKALIRNWADQNGYAYEYSLGEAPETVRGAADGQDADHRAAAIDWEAVGERPYVPEIDDNPKATATVHVPDEFHADHVKPYIPQYRVPFWVLNHPTKENDYHVLMGLPGMEHMGIHEVHDRGFDQYGTAASGGIMPAGSGKIGGPTYDKDTVEFYLNHQRSVVPDEYAAEQHYWDWEEFKENPNAFRQEDAERLFDINWQLDLERKRDDAMYKAVEQAIKDHPVLRQHYKDFSPMVRAEDPIDFEKFGATLPDMRVVAFEHIAFEDDDSWIPDPDDPDDMDWREELTDHKQLEPWKPGYDGKGILHHDNSITTWTNPKIHHQDVERFLRPHGKRTKAFIDQIHPDGMALFEGKEADKKVLQAKGMRPVGMEDYDIDFEVFGTPEHESIMKEFAL